MDAARRKPPSRQVRGHPTRGRKATPTVSCMSQLSISLRRRGKPAAHGAYAPSKAAKSRWDGQDTKGTWWMPWRWKSMKDVVSCDKPRVGATTVDPGISEWGNPAGVMSRHPMPKLLSGILSMGGEAGELKHLSSRTKERNFDSLSSGERNGNSLNRWSSDQRGCRAVHKV